MREKKLDHYTARTLDTLRKAYKFPLEKSGNDLGRCVLKDLRCKLKMSQTKFSEYIGVPMRTLQNWEYGVHRIPEYVVRDVALLKTVLFGKTGTLQDK